MAKKRTPKKTPPKKTTPKKTPPKKTTPKKKTKGKKVSQAYKTKINKSAKWSKAQIVKCIKDHIGGKVRVGKDGLEYTMLQATVFTNKLCKMCVTFMEKAKRITLLGKDIDEAKFLLGYPFSMKTGVTKFGASRYKSSDGQGFPVQKMINMLKAGLVKGGMTSIPRVSQKAGNNAVLAYSTTLISFIQGLGSSANDIYAQLGRITIKEKMLAVALGIAKKSKLT
jgi:histone H3/H4